MLQPLAKVHASVHHRETKRLMRPVRSLVVDQCVRRHLKAALDSRPVLGRTHQFSANPSIAKPFVNEPAFHESVAIHDTGVNAFCHWTPKVKGQHYKLLQSRKVLARSSFVLDAANFLTNNPPSPSEHVDGMLALIGVV